MTLIALLGSVFSPYYAWARARHGSVDALEHNAMNVALYGPRSHAWAMTERRAGSIARSGDHLGIGPSSMQWDGAALRVRLDEVTAPLPSRIRGEIRLHPLALAQQEFALDAAGAHTWAPIATRARVEVDLERPRLRWQGEGYFDSNRGLRPLEADFASWTWSRAPTGSGATVLYDVERADGSSLELALAYDRNGVATRMPPPPRCVLPRTGWRVARSTRSDAGAPARVVRTLEDGPFYARSLVRSTLGGESALAVHESLSLRRFASPWVRWMLPFRMPREPGARRAAASRAR